MRWLGLAVLVLVLGGCVPIPVSAECRARMSECLRDCPDSRPLYPDLERSEPRDTRTDCHKRCHALCGAIF